jgi:hypothetical protein
VGCGDDPSGGSGIGATQVGRRRDREAVPPRTNDPRRSFLCRGGMGCMPARCQRHARRMPGDQADQLVRAHAVCDSSTSSGGRSTRTSFRIADEQQAGS